MKSAPFLRLVLAGLLTFGASGCVEPVEPAEVPTINPGSNTVAIAADGTVMWNERAVSLEELAQRLEETKDLPQAPELTLEPDQLAPYDVSAAVLTVIKESGVTKFGFVGNEKYRLRGAEDGN